MLSNLDRYKKDLAALITRGDFLLLAMQRECSPEDFDKKVSARHKDKAEEFLRKVPSFTASYQRWYSEAKSLVKQILPDRLLDFAAYYERPRARKNLTYETYKIEDY